MRKRVKMAFAVVVVGTVGVIAWELLCQREPVYAGKHLGNWIRRFGQIRFSEPYTIDVPALDSNAVPFLVEYLARRHDGPFHRSYVATWPKLTDRMRDRLPRPVPTELVRLNTVLVLGRMGADAKPAIPRLIRILKEDEVGGIRFAAAKALRRLAGEDPMVKTALVEALKETNVDIRLEAASGLVDSGVTGPAVLTAVRGCLSDPTCYVRQWATNLLERMSPRPLNETNGESGAKAGINTNSPGL
jgi:hypothetical protein